MNEKRRISPLFNRAFVRIFGQERSKRITLDLVNCILDRAGIEQLDCIDEIEAERTIAEGSVDCRGSRFDVLLVAENRMVDVEAQTYPDEIENRALFYAAKMLSAHTPRGASFEDLPQAIVIVLLDSTPILPDSPEWVSVCRMHWEGTAGNKPATDRIAFVLVELDKVRARYTTLDAEVLDDPLVAWAYLLATGFAEESEVNAIMDRFPTLEEFADLYGYALGDPELTRAYDSYSIAEMNRKTRQKYFERVTREAQERGMAEGRERGLAEGRAEGRAEVVEQLRELGADESLLAALATR